MVCVFLVLLVFSERGDHFHSLIKNIQLHDTPSNNAMSILKYLVKGGFVLKMGFCGSWGALKRRRFLICLFSSFLIAHVYFK